MLSVYAIVVFIVGSSLLAAFLFSRIMLTASLVDDKVTVWLRPLVMVLSLWSIVSLILALSPVFRTPWVLSVNPRVLLALSIFTPVLVNVLLLRSPLHQKLVQAVRLDHIVLVHTLRAVVGSSFLGLYALGYLSRGFALEAGLGDIAIGLSAIVVSLLLKNKARVAVPIAVAWNILGMIDLALALKLGLGELIPFIVSTQTPLLIGMVPLLAVPLFLIWHLYSLYVLYPKLRKTTGVAKAI
jgi:hypothetical protein